MIIEVFILFVIYQIKHFLADFPLQNSYMLGKFKAGLDFIKPLAAHCGVHAGFTLLITAGYMFYKDSLSPQNWYIPFAFAVMDFVIHFIMDRIKAAPKWWGRYTVASPRELGSMRKYIRMNRKNRRARKLRGELTPAMQAGKLIRDNEIFWMCLGFDQMVHHLTHYGILWLLINQV